MQRTNRERRPGPGNGPNPERCAGVGKRRDDGRARTGPGSTGPDNVVIHWTDGGRVPVGDGLDNVIEKLQGTGLRLPKQREHLFGGGSGASVARNSSHVPVTQVNHGTELQRTFRRTVTTGRINEILERHSRVGVDKALVVVPEPVPLLIQSTAIRRP